MKLRAVLGATLALAVIALAPSPVAACLCGSTSADPPILGDVAFIGVVAARNDPAIFETPGPGYGVTYTFAVEEVILGEVGPFTEVLTGWGGGDCGLPMAVGERWRIDAYRFEGDLWANICSGSQLLDVGVPAPPVPGGVPPAGLAAVGAVLGVGASVLLVRRRRRRGMSVT